MNSTDSAGLRLTTGISGGISTDLGLGSLEDGLSDDTTDAAELPAMGAESGPGAGLMTRDGAGLTRGGMGW